MAMSRSASRSAPESTWDFGHEICDLGLHVSGKGRCKFLGLPRAVLPVTRFSYSWSRPMTTTQQRIGLLTRKASPCLQ